MAYSKSCRNCKRINILEPVLIIELLVFEVFKNNANKTNIWFSCQIDGITGAKYTFEELITNFTKIASGLRRLGVRKGDVISLFCPNCPEWVFMFFGILANGASVTTVNPAYTTCNQTWLPSWFNTNFIFTVMKSYNGHEYFLISNLENIIHISKHGYMEIIRGYWDLSLLIVCNTNIFAFQMS